jgi:RNA polymerase sigma-54 factor
MALSPKLELRQGQGLVMTPQLQQAIKLLQLSHVELVAFVEEELERNPLLERAAGEEGPGEEGGGPDWPDDPLGQAAQTIREAIDADPESVFPEDGPNGNGTAAPTGAERGALGQDGPLGAAGGGTGAADLESFATRPPTLADHLEAQLALAGLDAVRRAIAQALIDGLDECGYLVPPLGELAERLGAPLFLVEETLRVLQGFEPAGLFARSLSECLMLQLADRGRLDGTMRALLDNLDLVARREIGALARRIGTDEGRAMVLVSELRRLNPKPGLSFGGGTVASVVPDILVVKGADGGWHLELNPETLPRVLVNQTYYAHVAGRARASAEKTFLADSLQTANWLVRSLESRARTILKVAAEIVRQQDGFLAHGVAHLRPLNLRAIAEAIGMHESTVSRVTSNKYMATPRGIFELKFFFTAAIAATDGGEAVSAEAVRHRIKALIDAEHPDNILSDDTIVKLLRDGGIDVARRTVAKYREGLRIPSSVQRRREKRVALV